MRPTAEGRHLPLRCQASGEERNERRGVAAQTSCCMHAALHLLPCLIRALHFLRCPRGLSAQEIRGTADAQALAALAALKQAGALVPGMEAAALDSLRSSLDSVLSDRAAAAAAEAGKPAVGSGSQRQRQAATAAEAAGPSKCCCEKGRCKDGRCLCVTAGRGCDPDVCKCKGCTNIREVRRRVGCGLCCGCLPGRPLRDAVPVLTRCHPSPAMQSPAAAAAGAGLAGAAAAAEAPGSPMHQQQQSAAPAGRMHQQQQPEQPVAAAVAAAEAGGPARRRRRRRAFSAAACGCTKGCTTKVCACVKAKRGCNPDVCICKGCANPHGVRRRPGRAALPCIEPGDAAGLR